MRNRLLKLRISLLFTGVGCLWLSCSSVPPSPPSAEGANAPPTEELFREANREDLLATARTIITADPAAALVTVDREGRPRVRSVNTSEPDSTMSIWIATRPNTRKVEQIQGNPNVTLYYNDDAGGSYVSIMGTAVLHSDLATIEAKNPFSDERTARFWPEYPEGIVVIEVRPVWLEVMGQGIAASDDTWRPQAVVFPRSQGGSSDFSR